MPTKLNTLTARVAIGQVSGPNGKPVDVFATPEFIRMMADLLARVGGPTAFNTDEVIGLIATDPTQSALVGVLTARIEQLSAELASANATNARIASLERKLDEMARLVNSAGPAPTDWEHAGKIGFSAPNSGKFTTLEATNKVKLNPKDQPVEIKPTGTALVTIQPEQSGQVDNMELGKTAPRPARALTLNKVTITEPTTGATITLADGAALVVPGAGGTLGSAAYTPSSSYAGRSATALGGPATDAATTQALANSIRTVLISVGIGS